MLLVDGGWIEAVPVKTAHELGASCAIGVDIQAGMQQEDAAGSALDIVFRADKATRNALLDEKNRYADFMIKPEIGDYHWADFSNMDLFIQRGRETAESCLGEIKHILGRRKAKGPLSRITRFMRE
jgi:NTE family protein